MAINKCSVDILLCIAEQLCLKDLLSLLSCNHSLYCLRDLECIWKQKCRYDFGLVYNHPDQLYKTLYQHTHLRAFAGRRPCHHLSSLPFAPVPLSLRSQLYPFEIQDSKQGADPHCEQCAIVGIQNLYLCACFKILCDRHARLHSRHCYDPRHSIFMKLNTAELFCQTCVDWVGGANSDPAEQFKTQTLIEHWIPHVYVPEALYIITLQEKRRHERFLRWQDSPLQIMMEPYGYCFIPSQWIARWELFVEGWHTLPPDTPIDHDQWRLLMSNNDSPETIAINFSPSSSASCDLVVVSHQTWSWLLSKYAVVGDPITEDDLRKWKLDKDWQKRLELWRSRLLL